MFRIIMSYSVRFIPATQHAPVKRVGAVRLHVISVLRKKAIDEARKICADGTTDECAAAWADNS